MGLAAINGDKRARSPLLIPCCPLRLTWQRAIAWITKDMDEATVAYITEPEEKVSLND